VKISPCEAPLERLGDGLVVDLEVQQPFLEGGERVEVVGRGIGVNAEFLRLGSGLRWESGLNSCALQ
jgi:hypothetical protein